MPGFRRVTNAFPGFQVLGNIESVNIIDIPPPATPLGAGSGVVGVVGEYESGPFNSPQRVFGGQDIVTRFGGFGFEKDGSPYSGPTSVRSAESTQFWEGNGFLSIRNKRFAGLVITRVDNSSGSVTLNRLACKVGTERAPYNMEPGQTVLVSVDGGGAATATVDAAVATVAGNGFPGPAAQVWQFDDSGSTYVDLTAGFNDASDADVSPLPATPATDDAFIVGFSRAFDRLLMDGANGTAGVGGTVVWEYSTGVGTWSPLAGVSDGTAGFTAPVSDGQVVSWSVPTDWAEGTENSVTAYYVRARVTAGHSTDPVYDQGFIEQQNVTGFLGGETLEVSIDQGPVRVLSFTAAEQTLAQVVSRINSLLAATVASEGAGQLSLSSLVRGTSGQVRIVGGTGRATLGHIVGTTMGTGDVANIDQVQQTELEAVIETDIPGTRVDTNADQFLRLCAETTPGSGTIQVTGGTGLTALGLAVDVSAISAATGSRAVTVPAGTRVRDAATNTSWSLMQDTLFAANVGGPIQAKVRPFIDDDTAPTAAAGTITEIVDTLDDGFAVTNTVAINRISAAALDAAYEAAFIATLDVNGEPFNINTMFAARHTANIQRFGRDNALTATSTGHRARKFITAPPIGTSREDARALTGVGVGNIRNQRAFYTFPGVTTFVTEIARRGTDGGPGFTADGVVQLPSDGFYASVRSLLPPEENAGQQLRDTTVGPINALSLENAYERSQNGVGLTILDYQSFRDNGIIAPRADRVSGLIFQSDVTSVDPNTDSALADAKRRYMGDFIIDSLFDIAVRFVKKLNTPRRRRALTNEMNTFLNLLRSVNQPDLARIESFSVRDDTTDEQRAAGFQLYTVQVRLFASMDFIVITTEVGTTVRVEQA